MDYGPPYVERAVSLAENLKIDYDLLREVQGRTITLGEPAVPIIPDVDAMCAALERLFEIRHILVHEYPQSPVYRPQEISRMLEAAAEFADATSEFCTELLYGRQPLTTADKQNAAYNELEHLEAELTDVLALIMGKSDAEAKSLLAGAQQQWLEYRKRECAVRADLVRGGTLSGLLWLLEAKKLTVVRLDQLRWYLERKEGDV